MKKIIFSFAIVISISFNQFVFSQGFWIQKASIPSTARWGAIGFSVGTKGYVGTGYDGINNFGDFWEYNPSTNSWTQRASIPVRRAASAFTIGNKGYVCLGANNTSGPTLTDMWEYDPSNNTWVQKANFPSSPRYGAAGFAIGNKGYVACGNEGTASGPYTNEVWEFDPSANTWTQKQSFPGSPRYGLTEMGWAIGNKGYLGFGLESGNSWPSDFYEYDPANNSWLQKANFPLTGRSYGVAFSTCNKYFAGTGQNNGNAMQDIWQYDPSTDSWTQMANFGGGNRWLMASFVIGGNGYCGTGYDFTNYYNDWWMYTCDNNIGINEENATQNITSIYPTIISDYAILEISSAIKINKAEIKIFDMTGRLLRKEIFNANYFKLYRENLQQGVYSYDVANENKKIGYGKFIIN